MTSAEGRAARYYGLQGECYGRLLGTPHHDRTRSDRVRSRATLLVADSRPWLPAAERVDLVALDGPAIELAALRHGTAVRCVGHVTLWRYWKPGGELVARLRLTLRVLEILPDEAVPALTGTERTEDEDSDSHDTDRWQPGLFPSAQRPPDDGDGA